MAQRRSHWWRRTGSKETGFAYVDKNGAPIDSAGLARTRSLSIPPAWTEVRICPNEGGKIQAIGNDSRGRIQYIYHPRFVGSRQKKKFGKLQDFADALPTLRDRIAKDLARDGLPRKKVLAVILRIINEFYFRPGSRRSVDRHNTFGITTLKNSHVTIDGDRVSFDFVGKHYIRHRREVEDKRVAEIMRELKAIRHRHLFKYIDPDGIVREITAADLNDYIKEFAGPAFTAKDMRTWGATVRAAVELARLGPVRGITSIRKNIVVATRAVAEYLGNTPAVSRRSYIHPRIVKAYERGKTIYGWMQRLGSKLRGKKSVLSPEEKAVQDLLRS